VTGDLHAAGALAMAAALGSLPVGWWIGRAAAGEDLRETGSGSTGATNVARRVGAAAGAATLLADAAKGAAAVYGAGLWTPRPGVAAAAAVVVVALHCWNPWLGWRGGRGVAPAAGAFGVLTPTATLGAAGLFAAVLLVGRRVSAASLAAALALPVAALLRGAPGTTILAASVVFVVVVVRHRGNLRRLREGTEPEWGARRRPPEE
jgi:glycerol-3-phosphate acyltransferase PlsY